ncbi:bifunctional adenosylcobinamide kinase/adenosylcobinamide-phosphate guanylyltransferase [Oceanobacillus senegalensis]|uniref:bifunctional adenosylcobinamide kinase/adenosylcobinamide-phosphate guanylyltransferase n=1 Tax=Oceanobacillus senegalensis TaxID=1936063 RepID=UPI000A30B0F5|nr:bifunctional adenosylcobinamide kinase/adenosylcobinamide-phosphate guanylyltransferase [Oceanobacillus senegalensis]
MHFVTGGAFNGKRGWVKKYYPSYDWISLYDGDDLRNDFSHMNSSILVIEGIETWFKKLCYEMDVTEAICEWRTMLEKWEEWECKDPNRQVIIIGTDITKGIVPIEKIDRNWRDLTGWAYQDLTHKSNRVDIIWYGLCHRMK